MEFVCTTSAECAELTDGCCMTSMIDSVAEDSVWGLMPAIEVGQQPGQCVSAAEQAAAEAAEYPMTGMDMLNQWIASASEEELAEIGLFPGDDAIYLVEAMGSDEYTMTEVVISSANCVDAAEDAAVALTAGATLLAVALLQ